MASVIRGTDALDSALRLGFNQTWQSLIASRVANTDYTNTTGRPIMVSVSGYNASSLIFLTIGGVVVSYNGDTVANCTMNVSAIIPPGAVYRVNAIVVTHWAELR